MSVVVFGGNGFVGTNILKVLVARGIPAVSVSRTGTAPTHLKEEGWARKVKWIAGDALNPPTYISAFEGEQDAKLVKPEVEESTDRPLSSFEKAVQAANSELGGSSGVGGVKNMARYEGFPAARAVVVAVGSPPVPFVDEAWQTKMNGTTNSTVVEAAAAAGVSRVVLINALTPKWAPAGYVNGKKMAEESARSFVQGEVEADAKLSESTQSSAASNTKGALVLKPGAVFGTRRTAKGLPIPLGPVMAPVSWVLREKSPLSGVAAAARSALPYVLEGALVPPVSVEVLAEAAVEGAIDDAYAGRFTIRDAFELTK